METDPLHKPSEPVTPVEASEIETPTTKGPSEIVSHIPPTPSYPPEPNYQRRDHTPTWKKVLEYIAVAIALGLLVVNIFQMSATRDAANAAKTAAEAATRSNEITTMLDQPYFDLAVQYYEHDGTVCAVFTNFGKWPAGNVSVIAIVTAKRITDGTTTAETRLDWTPQGSIARPSNDIKRCVILFGALRDEAFNNALGLNQISVDGRITYDAGFGRTTSQHFCKSLVADETMNGIGKALNVRIPDCVDAAQFVRVRRKQLRDDQSRNEKTQAQPNK